MNPKVFSPDDIVYLEWGWFELNATLVFTWVTMAILVVGAAIVTRRLKTGPRMSRWQNLVEVVVSYMRSEIRNITQQDPGIYLPFVGTLFLFILGCSLLAVVPGYSPPTASLSTTAAQAICVFVSVPLFGIVREGVGAYMKHYIEPTPLMLPFNIMSELSRTLALAVRLFGNMLSGMKVAAILVSLVPFLFPIVFNLLGLLIGIIQAYIFTVLALVYIASGTRSAKEQEEKVRDESSETPNTQT